MSIWNRRQRPGAAEHVLEVGLDLRRVEGRLALLDLALEPGPLHRVDERLLGDVPIRGLSEELLRSGRNGHLDAVDAELVVDLGGHPEEAVDLVGHLRRLAVDVRVVLGRRCARG